MHFSKTIFWNLFSLTFILISPIWMIIITSFTELYVSNILPWPYFFLIFSYVKILIFWCILFVEITTLVLGIFIWMGYTSFYLLPENIFFSDFFMFIFTDYFDLWLLKLNPNFFIAFYISKSASLSIVSVNTLRL